MPTIYCKGLIFFLLLLPFTLFSQKEPSTKNTLSIPIVEWDKTIGDSTYNSAWEIIATSDGGFLIAGGFIIEKYLEEAFKDKPDDLGSYSILKIDSIGNVLWHKVFKTDGHDVLMTAIQTKDEGFLLGGRSQSGAFGDKSEPNKGYHDYWLIKLDAAGNKQWDKSFGGNSADYLWAIAQTPDGGYLLSGESSSGATGDKSDESKGDDDAWIIKIDAQGNKEWDQTFGGGSADVCGSIVVNPDGSALLGCISNSFNPYGEDYWIIKIDAQGNQLWDKTFMAGQLQHVFPTTDQGYILVGNSWWNSRNAESDCWVLKVDSLGNKEWDKIIGGDKGEFVHHAISLEDESIVIGLQSYSDASYDKNEDNRGIYDFWIVNIDFSGNIIWDKTIGGNKEDYLSSLSATKDGGIIATGYSDSDISGEKTEKNLGLHDIWIVKLNDEENIHYPIVRDIPTDTTVYVNADSCGTHVFWREPYVFNPQLFPLTATHPPGSFFPLGKTTVTYTVKDRQGKATDFTFDVTVNGAALDTVPPKTVLDSLPAITASCSVSEVPVPTAMDACIGTVNGITTDPIAYDQPGSYTITWQYQDVSGNTSYQLQQVIIADTLPPVPLQDILPVLHGDCEIIVVEIPEAEDNCGGLIKGSTKDSLKYDLPGEYLITWYFVDDTGNQSQQIQKVVIRHSHAPVPQLDTLPILTGNCKVKVPDKPLADSFCGQTITATTSDPLEYEEAGEYVIHWIFTDSHGNTSSQEQKISITCEEDTVLTHVEELGGDRSVNFFPNPVRDEVTLSLPAQYNKKILEADVYHLSGMLFQTTNLIIEDDQTILSLATLPQGIYIIKIRDQGKHILTTKILKE